MCKQERNVSCEDKVEYLISGVGVCERKYVLNYVKIYGLAILINDKGNIVII
jgi:hypothetical protein